MGPEWAAWRVIEEGLAPDILTVRRMTLDEIYDANEYIDASYDAKAIVKAAAEEAHRRAQSGGLNLGDRPEDPGAPPDAEAAAEALRVLEEAGFGGENVLTEDLRKMIEAAEAAAADDADEPIE